MYGQHLVTAIKEWLEAEVHLNAGHLVTGYAKDYAEYKDRTGYIRALQVTIKEITALERKDESTPTELKT